MFKRTGLLKADQTTRSVDEPSQTVIVDGPSVIASKELPEKRGKTKNKKAKIFYDMNKEMDRIFQVFF